MRKSEFRKISHIRGITSTATMMTMKPQVCKICVADSVADSVRKIWKKKYGTVS